MDLRRGDRRAQQLGSEGILIWHLVGFLCFRIVVIHGKDQRKVFFISSVVHGVEIRHQSVAQSEEVLHHLSNVFPVSPGLFSAELAVAGMETHHRGEHSQLYPASCHLVIFIASHMASDIMAPHAVADIGSCRGKVRLEVQRFPGDDGVSGKSDGISVAARSCVSGKGHGTFSPSFVVQIMVMVQHPERIQAFYLADPSGLPVQPPEVHALVFHGMVNMFKAGFQELGICRVKVYRLLLFPVCSHFLCHCSVLFFMGPYSVCRMDV